MTLRLSHVQAVLGVLALGICARTSAWAAEGAWMCTAPGANGLWTNSLNWSGTTYPSGIEPAWFTSDGNGQSTVDLSGLSFIKFITFDTPAVGAFTLGTGAANSQTLVLADNGEIRLSSTAANSQIFNCGIQLGIDRTAQSYYLNNENASQSLTFNDLFFVSQDVGNNTGNKTLVVKGVGPVSILGSIRQNGATTLFLHQINSSTLTLSGSNVVTALYMYGGPSSVLDIGSQELVLNSNGGNVLNCYLGGTITGSGKLRLSTWDSYSSAGVNYADLNVVAGKTLVINCEITGPGGLESNSGTGMFVLNGTNTFLGHMNLATAGGTFSVSTIGNRGVPSNCGMGTNLYFANTGRLLYTGSGEDTDRPIVMNANGTVEQAGPNGTLRFTATPILINGSRTLVLQGATAGLGEFSAVLSNTGGNTLSIVKNDEGTWLFSATNTYTGSTTINGGKLLLGPAASLASGSAVLVNYGATLAGSGRANGSVSVAAGGVVMPGDGNSVGTLTLGGAAGLTNAVLCFDLVSPDTVGVVTDKVTVVGAATVSGTNTIVLSFPNGSAPEGSYTLMTFASRTGTGTFALAAPYPNATLTTNATSVTLNVVGGSTSVTTWKGVSSSSWDGSDLNWTNGSDAVAYTPGEAVTFDDTAAQFTVSSAAPVAPASVVVNNANNAYTIGAVISGACPVYKLGLGLLTLTGANTYAGPTEIAGGTLKIAEAGQLGNGNYGTNLINNGEFVYASSVAQTNSGVISGGGNLTQMGPGVLTLMGNNTYVGRTTVTSGVLRAQHANALGSTAQGTLVTTGATLDVVGSITTASEAINVYGTLSSSSGSNIVSGIVSLQDGATLDVAANAALVMNGMTPAIGSNVVTKTGAGLLRFAADPNQNGTLVINEGVVEFQHSGSTDMHYIINPNGTLRQNTKDDIGDNYLIQVDGVLDFRNNDAVGGIPGSGLITNSGVNAVAITVCNNNQSGLFSGKICNGAGSATLAVTKTGSGFLTLSGASTFSGGFTVSGGLLNINTGGSTSSESAIGRGTFTISGSCVIDNTSSADVTLQPVIAQNWNSDFTFAGTKNLNLGLGNVVLGANRTVTVATNTLTVGGAIAGAYSLTKNGAGTLVLNGNNTYSGSTTINGGALLVNGSTAAGSLTLNSGLLGGSGLANGAVTVSAGSVVAPGGLGSVGTFALGAGSSALTLNSAVLAFDLSTVAGSGDYLKLTNSTGKLILNGTNVVALNFPAGGAPAGNYVLMTCPAGVTTNAGAALKLLTAYPNASLAMVSTNLVLTLSDTTTPGVAWQGSASGKWDGGDLNWTADGSTAIAYPANVGVVFDDSAAQYSIFSDAAVAPATLLFNNSVNGYTVSAALTGAAPLVKIGTAPVSFFETSGYNPASILVGDGPLSFTLLNSGDYAGNIANNSDLIFSNDAVQALSGTIAGGGRLIKNGVGVLTLAGSNFYSGVTTINNGRIKVTHPYGLGRTDNGTVVNMGAALELAGNVSTLSEAVTLYGLLANQTDVNTLNGTLTLFTGASIDVSADSTLVLKSIQANGPFTKTGSGLLRLTADPNGSGVMIVQAGTVEAAASTMDASVVVKSGATLIGNHNSAFHDTLTRIQLDTGSTYILRLSDQSAGLAGGGIVTQDQPGLASLLTIGANNFSETFSGSIQDGSGLLSFMKVGSGVQTLTGVNTYTGPTIVGAGTLLVNSPGSLAGTAVTVSNSAAFGGNCTVGGAVTVQSGGLLIAGGRDAVGTLALGSTLALNSSTLFVDLPASGSVGDQVTVAGTLTLEGVNTIVLGFPQGVAQEGDYTLMTFASRSGAGSFAPLTSYPNATLELTETSLILHIASGSGGLSGLSWVGSISPQWDGGILNWKKNGEDASFASGNAVLFDDTTLSQYTVRSAANVAPSAIAINNSGTPYYLTAPITGTAPLSKSGVGMACINGSTAYNPASILINAGTLMVGNAAQLNSGTYTGPVIVNGNFNHYSSANLVMSGLISGLGSVSKTGGGTLTLIGTNTFIGGASVSSGTLIGRASPLVFGPGNITASGGTLELQNDTNMVLTNRVNFNANTTFRSGRVTAGAGTAHTLGDVTLNNSADITWTVSAGSNISANSPYGLTIGSFTFNGRNPIFTVNNNGTGMATFTMGPVVGNNNMTKSGSGTLFLPVAGNTGRSSASTTLSSGVLKLGAPGALGTAGATLTLNGGALDLAIDSSVFAHNTTVGGNVTCQCDRATANSAGITHTLGTLTIGAYTLSVTNGPNVVVRSPYGLTFGTVTQNGNITIDVADAGTLTLGAMTGNYTLTKRNHGVLKLVGVNASTAATTVNQGKLVGVTGGSSANSAFTLQSTGLSNAVARLGVLCATTNGQWTCSSLTVSAATAPATTNPVLEFAFSVPPSGTVAPLRVTGAATFTATPSAVAVYLNSLSVTNGIYPLLTVGSAATKPTPALIVYGGYAGSTLAWTGNTLYLTLNGSPTPIQWASGSAGSGAWDVNNDLNLVWQDNQSSAVSYYEYPAGVAGSRVIFDDTLISVDTAVTLDSIVSPTSLVFSNSAYRYTFSGGGGIAGNVALVKIGTHSVTMGMPNVYTGGTTVVEGALRFSNGGGLNASNSDIVVANAPYTNALVAVDAGASVTSRWIQVGTSTNAAGAIVNQGALACVGTANSMNFALGWAAGSYGYYRHDSAIPLTLQETGIGGAFGGYGVLDVMQGVITNVSYFQLNRSQVNNLQYSQLNLLGGSLVMPNSNANAHYFYSSGTFGHAVINVANGGVLGSIGTTTELDLIKASTSASALAVLNVYNGGVLLTRRVKASQSAGTALVNLNGGIIRANYSSLVLGGSNIDRATIYENGVVVDTGNNFVTISQALLAPTGNGVLSIPVTVNGAGYVGRPIVVITGGGGTGATAIADFDPATGEVTGVTVTNPGYNYTTAPSVAFVGGGGIAPTVGTVTIGATTSGGLTVMGGGMLTLSGVNTYTGMTTVSNSTLRLGAINALPTNAPITVVNGTLDLNGFTVTNNAITLINSAVVNGTLVSPAFQNPSTGVIQARVVSTNALVKNGPDTLIIAAPMSYTGDTVINGGTVKLSGRQPGLYEGRITGNSFDLNSANPKTATPLSTRYANMWFVDATSAGGIWPDNTTYIYSGYLWNDAPTNETWSFFRCFDDSTRLMINGTNVLMNQNMSGVTVISNAVVKPGPNLFELRLGEGSGSIGNNNASFTNMGVGYDRLGRRQAVFSYFKTLTDPGDGSLLTLTNVFDLANANVLPTNSAVVLANGATLDLGGTGQRVGGLSGEGTVSNGALTVNGVITPGGAGVGTLTLSTTPTTLSGTLRVNLAADGTGDLLSLSSDASLADLDLVVEEGVTPDPSQEYTLVTSTGTLSGVFKSRSLPKGWVVEYRTHEVVLKYLGGMILIVR